MKIQSLFMGMALALAAAGGAQAQLSFGAISGRLVDEKGTPIVGVQITLEAATEASKLKTQTMETNKKGIFSNDRVLPGAYRITFFKEGFDKMQGPIDIVKNQPKELGDIKLAPASANPNTKLGEADTLMKDGKYDEAAAAFKDLIASVGPRLPAAEVAKLYFNLGLAHEKKVGSESADAADAKKQDWDNAEAAYKKAIELDPTLMHAYGGLGNVYQATNRPDDAIKLLQSAASVQPDNGRLAMDLGLFLWSKGQNQEAYEALTRAAKLLPDNADVEYHLGVTSISLNKPEEALQHLEKFMAMHPTDSNNVESAKQLIPAIKATVANAKK